MAHSALCNQALTLVAFRAASFKLNLVASLRRKILSLALLPCCVSLLLRKGRTPTLCAWGNSQSLQRPFYIEQFTFYRLSAVLRSTRLTELPEAPGFEGDDRTDAVVTSTLIYKMMNADHTGFSAPSSAMDISPLVSDTSSGSIYAKPAAEKKC